MFSFCNIYNSYKDCRKNKRCTINALRFEIDVVEEIWKLKDELDNRTYRPSRSICFLASSPKLREIFAANFRDRVVHHLLVDRLERFYEPKFIYDVYNNRYARGIHKAVERAKRFIQSNIDGYFLQLDIKGFFYSIDKNILFKRIFDDISKSDIEFKKEILWLSNVIIYHNPTKNYIFQGDENMRRLLPPHKSLFTLPPNIGLPIGNLTSQFFANVYMNGFDNYLKRVLKVRYYIRYVDDFVIFHNDRDFLIYIKNEIEQYLKRLNLTLREDSKLKRTNQGLDFLGYIIRPNYILVRNRVINRYRENIKNPNKNGDNILASFLGHIGHSDSYRLKTKTLKNFEGTKL